MKLIRIHPRDNVAVALEDLAQGEVLSVAGQALTAAEAIQRGHKLALSPIPAGSPATPGPSVGRASARYLRAAPTSRSGRFSLAGTRKRSAPPLALPGKSAQSV